MSQTQTPIQTQIPQIQVNIDEIRKTVESIENKLNRIFEVVRPLAKAVADMDPMLTLLVNVRWDMYYWRDRYVSDFRMRVSADYGRVENISSIKIYGHSGEIKTYKYDNESIKEIFSRFFSDIEVPDILMKKALSAIENIIDKFITIANQATYLYNDFEALSKSINEVREKLEDIESKLEEGEEEGDE